MGLEFIGEIAGGIVALVFGFEDLSNPWIWLVFLIGMVLLVGGIIEAIAFFTKDSHR